MSRTHRSVLWSNLLLTLLVTGSHGQPSVNLIPNSGFEEGDGARPAGWGSQAPFSKTFRASGYFTTGEDAPRNVVFEQDEHVRRSGRCSGHIRVVNGPKQQGTACWVGPFVPVDPTKRYVFRLYCRTRDTRYAFAIIFEYDKADELLSSRLLLHPKMTIGSFEAWQEKTYVLYPDMWNPKTAKVRVTLNVTSDTGKTSDVWFDDVSLMRFEPEDLPAIRRAIDDSPPPDKVAAYRRRHILFHATFDGKDHRADADFAEGLREPLQSQEIRFGPGRVGGAVQVTEPQGMLIYRAPRNFFPQRGAVAFWFKPIRRASPATHWS